MKEMSKLATPDYRLEDAQNVYPPSEDTFLLLDALEADQKVGWGFIEIFGPMNFSKNSKIKTEKI